MKKWIILSACVVGGAIALCANSWHPVPMSKLSYEAVADPIVGNVKIEIEQDDRGAVLNARIFAYGREFILPKEQLSSRQFRDRWYLISVSGDSGFIGSTLSVRLTSVAESVTISVTRKGDIQISRHARKSA